MSFEASATVLSTPEKVFTVYAAVSQWPLWDLEVDYASLDGPFTLGGTGKIKPKGAPESKIELIKFTKNKSFTTECNLPLSKMHFVHELSAFDDGSTRVVNKLIFSRLLAPVFSRLIGTGIGKKIPSTLNGLKSYVEAKA